MTDIADVIRIYQGSNGDATKALYAELEQLGPIGVIGVNLFRACKCSERAKAYRKGPGHKTAAYDRKDWSIGNLARALHVQHANQLLGIKWGWGSDEALRGRGDPHHHIIYVELPTGQVSFHTGTRHEGPDFAGQWDGVRRQSVDRICRFVARLLKPEVASA
jgi:hypothetical protein